MRKRSHKLEVEAVGRLVAACGGVCHVTHQCGRLRGSAGIPDLYLQFPGASPAWACWMEIKVGKDRLRPAQTDFVSNEMRCGGMVLVGGVDKLEDELRQRGMVL